MFGASFWAVLAEALVGSLNHDLLGHLPAILTMMAFPVIATVGNAFAKHLLVQVGAWRVSVVLVGGGEGAVAVEAALASDPGLGYAVVGRVEPQALVVRQEGPRLWPLLERFKGDRILLALDGDRTLQRQLIDCALRERVPFAIATEPHAFPAFGWQATRFFTHDVVMLSVRDGVSRHVSQILKSIIDVTAAAILLVLSSPFFLLVALMNLGSGGPIFFAHRRIGIGGKPFYCFKFRTMVINGDEILKDALERDPALAAEWHATQKLKNDPRVTRVGKFLRKTSLDELPQLINVLLRQMSLVGPRPIVESEVRFYGDDIAHYYATRPGVTGLWQVTRAEQHLLYAPGPARCLVRQQLDRMARYRRSLEDVSGCAGPYRRSLSGRASRVHRLPEFGFSAWLAALLLLPRKRRCRHSSPPGLHPRHQRRHLPHIARCQYACGSRLRSEELYRAAPLPRHSPGAGCRASRSMAK